MNRISPDEVLTTPAGELAALASESLFQLKNDAADLLAAAKAIVEHVDRALDLKYADRAHQLRLAAGKDTGVVHFDDGHVRITADLPKKVDWDQTRLAEITRRIAANGDDPSEYVDISYRISETKFNAWPESLKSALHWHAFQDRQAGLSSRSASGVIAMKTKPTLLELLRKKPEMYLRDLPETIRIPALDGNRPDEVVRRLEDATIDDVAFAIQGLESETRVIHRRLSGLRDLYEMARKRGALGMTTVADAFANISTEEAGK